MAYKGEQFERASEYQCRRTHQQKGALRAYMIERVMGSIDGVTHCSFTRLCHVERMRSEVFFSLRFLAQLLLATPTSFLGLDQNVSSTLLCGPTLSFKHVSSIFPSLSKSYSFSNPSLSWRRVRRRETVPRDFPFATSSFLEYKELLVSFVAYPSSSDIGCSGGVCSCESPVRRDRHYLLYVELDVELYHGEETLIGLAHVVDPNEGLGVLRHTNAILGIEVDGILRTCAIQRFLVAVQDSSDGLDIFRHYLILSAHSWLRSRRLRGDLDRTYEIPDMLRQQSTHTHAMAFTPR